MDIEDEAPPAKRFKHQSYNETLKEVHMPSALSQANLDINISDNQSCFHEALDHWRQLNLAPSFIKFAGKVNDISSSMPLLLLHWREVVDLWLEGEKLADDEGLRALLDLLQKLLHDLRTTMSPAYTDLLEPLIALLPRSLSAPTLTTLLAALTSLFKFLLVPSQDTALLERTWTALGVTLPKTNPEAQRAVAEVWGTVLRRLKPILREHAIGLIARDVEGVDDACAWAIVSACRSVSSTLHTSAPSIVGFLLVSHIASEEPHGTHTLLRRTLTALIHHCTSPEQFTLGDLIVSRVSAAASAYLSQDTIIEEERLRRMLEIAAVPCSVRRGSRLSQPHLTNLLTLLPTIPSTPALSPSLLHVTTAALTASSGSGDGALWASAPARAALAHAWTSSTDPANKTGFPRALALCGALAELGWAGWAAGALPGVLRETPRLLGVGVSGDDVEAETTTATLRFLAALRFQGRLDGADQVWKRRVGAWAEVRLRRWRLTSPGGVEADGRGSVAELHDVLILASALDSPALPQLLITIIENVLKTEDALQDYAVSLGNAAYVLALCMRALAGQRTKWDGDVDLAAWVRTVSQKWGWSEGALTGLVTLLETRAAHVQPIPLGDLWPHLRGAMLSHSRSLRLSALRLLCFSFVAYPEESEVAVARRCLQGEEVPLDVQGVRERVLRIGRVGQVVKDDDETGAELCVRWLIAQLKVNLRPLWTPAAEALAELGGRFGNLVWRLLFDELRNVCERGKDADRLPLWMPSHRPEAVQDEVSEEERTWRDPSAHKLRLAVAKWQREGDVEAEMIEDQRCADRSDSVMYESQLLVALSACHSLAEKHNRDLVPFFLSLLDRPGRTPLPRPKLTQWLALFAKFTNPKALHSTDRLHALYISLLAHADRALQTAALTCLLTYKSPHLVPHEGTLRTMLDDTRWRDQLALLDMAEFEPQDRPELVDVIVRLLFGVMMERRGRGRGADRRAAVLTALGGCTDGELDRLVDLMLRPLHREARVWEDSFELRPVEEDVSDKQQVGFLNLLADVLKNLGPRLVSGWSKLLATTLDLVAQAQTRIAAYGPEDTSPPEADDQDDQDEEEGADRVNESLGLPKTWRTIRQLGLKRLADFFRNPVTFDFTPYMTATFHTIISPRLSALDQENTQSPSALLDLFREWSQRKEYAGLLVDYDVRTLPKIFDCLVATNVKPVVVMRIFDIVEGLLELSETHDDIAQSVLKPCVSVLLVNVTVAIQRTKDLASPANPLAQRQLGILSRIAQYLSDGSQAATLLTLLSPPLRRPAKLVNEKTKADILKIVESLLPLIPELSDRESSVHTKTYGTLSYLLQHLRSRSCRTTLIACFDRLAAHDPSIEPLTELLRSLNAYSVKRLDEPDFDRRLTAFASLNDEIFATLSTREWLPVLYNMLSFIQDPNELAIRTSASSALKRFIDLVASIGSEYEAIFTRTLFPALKNGLRTKHELVRAEVLGVIAHAVKHCDKIVTLQEMRPLLADGDDEANFFNNVLHVQVHRRMRALRRLAEYSEQGRLRSVTLAEVFVPLVNNFITSADNLDHHLVNEAIVTTGRIAKQLAWGAYFSLVQQYLRLSKDKDKSERAYIRALIAILDNFHFPMDEAADESSVPAGNGDDDEDQTEETATQPSKPLDTTRVADAVNTRLLPALLLHLEKKDETEDSIRIPVAVGIAKVALHLPTATREPQIGRLLTVLSQILRSKSQEARDLTRETLCRVTVMLGPSYLPITLRELRTALLRGPQLHVLAFVVHALLVHVTSQEHVTTFKTLDSVVADAVHVSAEVIFGESGKDVQSEDFKTKMREVRTSSSKALDSFTILARQVTPTKIAELLQPIRSILQETSSLKVLQQVDEVLRRTVTGLNANEHLVPTELLSLCHTLVSRNAQFLKEGGHATKRKKGRKGDAIVQLKRKVGADINHFSSNAFRFVVFGLDLLNTAFRRGRFDYHDVQVLSRLEPMVAVIGNVLYSDNHQVLIYGLKAASVIVKAPLKSVDKSLPVLIRQMLEIVKQTGSTDSEVVQAALKALGTILRDCPAAEVKEKDLGFLLELLAPDLEEPSRQASSFVLLRAIVSRKFVVPEIYDIMDRVSEVMVTNQSAQVQELCRGVLLQFLLDYPQGKGRLRNQMTFLAKNLSYVYESGRISVMELLGAVVAKFDAKLIQEYADMLFVALVMVLANDEAAKCKEMAAALVQTLVTRLDAERQAAIMSHLRSWTTQQAQPRLSSVAAQTYGLLTSALQQQMIVRMSDILSDLNDLLIHSVDLLEGRAASDQDDDLEWQTPYQVLTTFGKIAKEFPDIVTRPDALRWEAVVEHLLFPHAWVRLASCRLLGQLFTAVPAAAPRDEGSADGPLSTAVMENVAKRLCEQLKSDHLDANLSLQIVKNLFYIGKCYCDVPLPSKDMAETDPANEDDDENDEDSGEPASEPKKDRQPLPWLFSKLSYQARSAHIARRNRAYANGNWVHQPTSVVQWFAAMVAFMQPSQVEMFLVHILSPIYRLVEDDTIRGSEMEELKTLSVELRDLVQSKVGASKFSSVYNQIRQGLIGVRRERKTARLLLATTNPQAAAKRKLGRNTNKKESRKRKDLASSEERRQNVFVKRKRID